MKSCHWATTLAAVVCFTIIDNAWHTVAADVDSTTSEGQIKVRAGDNGITIQAYQVPIVDILKAISRHVPLEVTAYEPLDQPVTRVIENMPLSQALGRVLKHRNFVLRHVPTARRISHGGRARLTRLWIYPRDTTFTGGAPAARIRTDDKETGATIAATDPLPSLRARLRDTDKAVRAEAISDLTMFADDHAVTELAAVLSDQEASVREEAVVALSSIDGELSGRLLNEALTDKDEVVREAAVDALSARGGDEAIRALGIALHDPVATLRVAAIETLGDLGGRDATALLQQALADPDPVIRRTASDKLDDLAEKAEQGLAKGDLKNGDRFIFLKK